MAMLSLYRHIGRVITRDIQQNENRAEYGATLLRESAGVTTQEYGEGYSRANLQDMRRFFESFEICQTPSTEFNRRLQIDFRKHCRPGWSHYRRDASTSSCSCATGCTR